MKLKLVRFLFTDKSATGRLFVDDKKECVTLEDKDRHLELHPEDKVQNQTAIPRGTYKIGWRYSPHFREKMPHLLDVPGFRYVYIHWGNEVDDTDGCVLVGTDYAEDWVSNSRSAYAKLRNKLAAATGDIYIEVI